MSVDAVEKAEVISVFVRLSGGCSCANPFLFLAPSCLTALGDPFFGAGHGVLFKFGIARLIMADFFRVKIAVRVQLLERCHRK